MKLKSKRTPANEALYNQLMKRDMSPTDLSNIIGCDKSTAWAMVYDPTYGLSYRQAKALNRLFETAEFEPFKIKNGIKVYNSYGCEKSNKVNEFKKGNSVINLQNKQIITIDQIKWLPKYKEWIYKSEEDRTSWISEYLLAPLSQPEPTPEEAFLNLVQEQLDEKKAALQVQAQPQQPQQPQPTKVVDTVPEEEQDVVMSISTLNKIEKKPELKQVILNIVSQLLDLI